MGAALLDEVVERSAAPATVTLAVTQLDEAHPGLRDRLSADAALTDALVAVVAASRFLTRLLLADRVALDLLGDLDRRLPRSETADDPGALVQWKRRELLRIAARDLTGGDGLEQVTAALAALAADVLDGAWRLGGPAAEGLAIIGMGKLGGRELNYASDIDVVFAGEGDARRVMDVARQCFRVDAALRPEGRDGPLTRTVESYERYWERWAQPWEFQALLKARPVAGAGPVGEDFVAAATRHLWGRTFDADDLRSLRMMKARTEGEVARRGLENRELKRGPGGIRDIEFAVQLLQLVHGRQDPTLRSPTTLEVLWELGAAGYVALSDATALDKAYRFLRAVEHRVQLVDEQQVHAVPADADARTRLARVMGYRDTAAATAIQQFDDELRRHQAVARSIHERLYFRPLLEAFSRGAADSPLSPDAAEARLAAFGFSDAARTRQALAELTSGLSRSSRLMQQLLPVLLSWLSESADPDAGLLGLRTLASGPHRTSRLVETFRESSEAARRLCLLLGTGRWMIERFEHHPDLIPALADDGALRSAGRAELLERARAALSWRADADDRQLGLYRLKRAEELRAGAADVLGLATVETTGRSLTTLAEAVVEASLATLEPAVPMAIVAMGRFGGGELSFASDLDVLIVYEGSTNEDFAVAESVAENLLPFIKGSTPAARIYTLDADLRPEGRDGPLARSLEGYRQYYRRWAQTWERQALLRARPIAGDSAVGAAFCAIAEEFVWGLPFTEAHAREIRRMKARIERERIPTNEDPQFHLKLGRGSLSDVEWTVQLLQLQHGVRASGTMAGIAALREAGVLAADDAETLTHAYAFCEQTRNRLFLVRGAPGDALPSDPDQLTKLARSLNRTGAELRDSYRRVTRRCRTVVERVFYGSTDA